MLRKLLLLLTTAALVTSLVFTGLQLGPILSSIEFPEVGDRFERSERRYTVTANVSTENEDPEDKTLGGTVSGTKDDYAKGETATLTATPYPGYSFQGWYSNNGTYKFNSDVYSFAVDKNITLTAKFVPTPESMEGTLGTASVYTECEESFEFVVYASGMSADNVRESVKVIETDFLGTDYEAEGKTEITVKEGTNPGQFVIAPSASKYAKGTTYSAVSTSENVSFDGGELKDLTFTIAGERSKVANLNEELIKLSDSVLQGGKIVTDHPLYTGDTVHVYKNWDYENDAPVLLGSKFLQIDQVSSNSGIYTASYNTVKEIENVYDALDIYTKETLGIDPENISPELAEELENAFRSNPSFHTALARAEQALYNVAGNNGCSIKLVGDENIDNHTEFFFTAFKTDDCISIEAEVVCSVPVYDKNGTEIASFRIKFNVTEEITVTPNVSIKLRKDYNVKSYNIGVKLEVNEETNVSYDFVGTSGATLDAIKTDFGNEIKKAAIGGSVFDEVKKTFANSENDAAMQSSIPLFKKDCTAVVENFNVSFNMSFFMNLDIDASLNYSSTCTQTYEVGFYSTGNGPREYEKITSSASCSDLVVSGAAKSAFGIQASFDFELIGLEELVNAHFDVEIGSYTDVSGCANINMGHNAAYLESGSYHSFNYSYSIFDNQLELTANEAEYKKILAYGYKNAIIGYANTAGIEKGKGFTIIEEETDISDIAFLSVIKLDTETLSVIKEALDGKNKNDYIIKVDLAPGSNLVYTGNGTLKVKNGAPVYFEETITVTVKSKSSKWTKADDSKVYVSLPSITVPVVFGDLDAYYDSMDTNIQKQFRKIYRNYKKETADILMNGFRELVDSFVTVPAEQNALYHDFTEAYLSELFALIGRYRDMEDDKRTYENKFVYTEATAFEHALNLIAELMDGKTIDENESRERIYQLLDDAEKTEALYNTLISQQNNAALIEQIEKNIKDSATRTRINEEIDNYAAAHTSEKAIALIEAARNLFPEI